MIDLETFRRILGNPAYEDEDVMLYHGDALNLLDAIPAASVQLTITSPPYNIGKEYEKRSQLSDYLEVQKLVIAECARVLKRAGAISVHAATAARA